MFKPTNKVIVSGITIAAILVATVFLNNSVSQNVLAQMMDKEGMMEK